MISGIFVIPVDGLERGSHLVQVQSVAGNLDRASAGFMTYIVTNKATAPPTLGRQLLGLGIHSVLTSSIPRLTVQTDQLAVLLRPLVKPINKIRQTMPVSQTQRWLSVLVCTELSIFLHVLVVLACARLDITSIMLWLPLHAACGMPSIAIFQWLVGENGLEPWLHLFFSFGPAVLVLYWYS